MREWNNNTIKQIKKYPFDWKLSLQIDVIFSLFIVQLKTRRNNLYVFLGNFNNVFWDGPTKKLICVSSRTFDNSNKISNREFVELVASKI